ncbi:MAG: hypothetical protein IZT59_06875 [Verrucomicrobia bacterium]|nr:hypothetical protein [Verrucomicrobiota bacterium]
MIKVLRKEVARPEKTCANSYGFRPNRDCKDALRKVEEYFGNGHHQVIDLDIRGYFDAIPHERLLREGVRNSV